MQQHSEQTYVSPLREMYQMRRNFMKLEKQRTDESCNRMTKSHREMIPQQLKFEEISDGRCTATSVNSIALHYEIKKPNCMVDWNKENKENQGTNRQRRTEPTKNTLDNQRQQINKTIVQVTYPQNQISKNGQKQHISLLKQQLDKLFETIKNDYTYTGV